MEKNYNSLLDFYNRYSRKKGHLLFLLLILVVLSSLKSYGQLPNDFVRVDLVSGLANSTNFKFAPDGRIFILDRFGEILIYKPDLQISVSAGTIPVFHELEDGLMGLAFDPDFENNNFIYFTYSPLDFNGNRVSRFTVTGDVLNLGSEVIIMEWETSRTALFHSGGDMDFDSQGNLYIASGDNTTYPNLYTAISNADADADASAEKSSSNTNDLRGKILRITPQAQAQPDGKFYTVPVGNLFPNGVGGLPEVYVMGARNPYRIFVDSDNEDWLFWGEVGPDANFNDPQNPNGPNNNLGPEGRDEINLTKTSGNYGWPYFSGTDNDPYLVVSESPAVYYDPLAPVNNSIFNTGVTNLPAAEPAWLDFFHQCYLAGFRYSYDTTLTDQQRLPVEFDNVFFYYNFNNSTVWGVTMDAQGTILSNEQIAPALFGVFPVSNKDGFIDMKMGPDGHMYILAYGAGCCPDNVGSGRLIRVDYTGITTNSPPTVVVNVNANNGALPLIVNFSSEGTNDPNGDTPLSYSWDFNSDGTPDSTEENPSFTYTTEGTFNAQLRVDDGNGGIGVKNVTIYAGNTTSTFDFTSPPDGGLFGWNDDINFSLNVNDVEDGAIDCNDVDVVPSLGHLNHFHDDSTVDACPKTLTIDDTDHDIDGEQDIFYVLGASYTDSGGLTSRDQIQLHPKRKEAEFFDNQNGTTIIVNTDPLEGGSQAIRVNNNNYISFSGRNLQNIDAVKYRVASSNAGGSIEFRLGSPTGTLIATTQVPSTGGTSTWVNVETPFTDPGGRNDVFFVFRNTSVQTNSFDLNYVEFLGNGISIDNSAPEVNTVTAISATSVAIQFSEPVNEASAETIANYSIDNGVSIAAANLLDDNRTIVLTTSTLNSAINYTITVSNVQNITNLPIVTNSYPFSLVGEVRINSGGPQLTVGGNIFIADQYSVGGLIFETTQAIEGTSDDALYQTERFASGSGNFSYEIPVGVAGEYDIRLHFAELFFGVGSQTGGPGSRVFNVFIEGNQVLTNFDILSEVDPLTALPKEFDNILVTDGFASIQFTDIVQSPKINGIEILAPNTFEGVSDASISITSPQEGWDVNQPFEVAFRVQNWIIEEGGTHVHYFVDDILVAPYYNYEPILLDDLSLGEHTIKIELFNANHTATGIFDEVTINVTGAITCNSLPFPDQWGVKQLETTSLPHPSVYTFADFDLDGDGWKDIVTGAWWYKNPGSIQGDWVRNDIGNTFNNVAFVYDFDEDGDLDLLGTTGAYTGAQLVWAQNDGTGNFTVFSNVPEGDTDFGEPFLAGIAGGVFQPGGPFQMAINWNGAESSGSPMQLLTPTSDPTTGTWSLVDIVGATSTGEDIQAGDIDQDNDLDLFQGSNWVRNNGDGTWTTFSTGITYPTTPDRAQLADFDRDGDLDAVVGQLSLPSNITGFTEFSWFSAPADPTQVWTRNILDTDINGSLSVFAVDIDFDGDKDIVVGEWRGAKRLIAFENNLCVDGTFTQRILDDGSLNQEHHDGARVTDIDNDGDFDIISNGWINNNNFPRIYENATIPPATDEPSVNAGIDQSILPDTVTLNGSANDPDGGAIASFAWTQISGPNTANLSGNTTANLTASGLVEGIYVFRLTATDDEGDTGFDEATITVSNQLSAIRINSGGPMFDFNGQNWSADQFFNGGDFTVNPIAIANTSNDELYQTERFSTGTLVYEIPVANGEHTINLHFAEIFHGVPGAGSGGGAGSRVFNVDIENGQGELTNYDIIVAAGGSATAIIERFANITVTDGSLTITLVGVTDFPKISGIEVVVPGAVDEGPIVSAGDDRTITLPNNSMTLDGAANDPDGGAIASYLWTQISGPNSATFSSVTESDPILSDLIEGSYVFSLTATDDEGDTGTDEVIITVASEPSSLLINSGGPTFTFNTEEWTADEFFVGGSTFENVIPIANTENDELYQTERFGPLTGTLTYEIPVENGNYNVDLHFAELFFGQPGEGASGGEGSRVFDISLEGGQIQIDNYDIIAEAGGSATAVVENYRNITVTDGLLTIILTAVTERPKISGIGIFEIRPPDVNAGADQTIVLPTNTAVLNGTASDPDGGIVTYQWTQANGPATATLVDADTANLTLSDLVEGTYVFRLTVIDDESETAFDEVTVTVSPEGVIIDGNMPPVAVAEASPISGAAPLLVTFIGSNSTDDVGVASYLWNFGDGTTSTEADPEKIYRVPGDYTVALTVTDDGGLTNTATLTINVDDDPEGSMSIILESNPPNPADGGIARIMIINKATDVDILNMTIHDVGGRYIAGFLASEIDNAGVYEMPIANLRGGLYFIRVILSQGESTLIKLVVVN